MGCAMALQKNNPAKIHIKKLNEIYVSYLKNQSRATDAWSETLSAQVIDSVTRYAQ